MSTNVVVLQGRLTRDPEMKYTPAGKAVVKFSLAIDGIKKDPQTDKPMGEFFNCVAWDKTAEFVGKFFIKGKEIIITGRLTQRSWVDDKDATKHSVVEVLADRASFCGPNTDGGTATTTTKPKASAVEDDDDSDPFADE